MRASSIGVLAAMWGASGAIRAEAQTEVHYQYGSHTNPFSEMSHGTAVLTLQHASFWKFGDNFFFVDVIDDGVDDGFNDTDFYGEWYSNLSLGKLAGRDLATGVFSDLGLIGGVAAGGDPNFMQWISGVRVSWRLPGFIFLNTDMMAGVDRSGGLDSGGAPKAGNRLIVDVNGLLPFNIGSQALSISGHVEYVGSTSDELGNDVNSWILAQPQLRWDVGQAFGGSANGLFAGIEYQYWRNKLGTDIDENVVQLLVVWQF